MVIFDDCILSGGTVIEASKLLRSKGATAVHFFATHAVFTPGATERLLNSDAVTSIVVTNSISHQEAFGAKITTLDVAPLFAEQLQTWI